MPSLTSELHFGGSTMSQCASSFIHKATFDGCSSELATFSVTFGSFGTLVPEHVQVTKLSLGIVSLIGGFSPSLLLVSCCPGPVAELAEGLLDNMI